MKVEFKCPECGSGTIEEIEVEIIVVSEVILLDGGGFDYGEQTNDNGPNGHVDRYQCGGCGWTIIEDTGKYEAHTQDGLGGEALISRIKELNND